MGLRVHRAVETIAADRAGSIIFVHGVAVPERFRVVHKLLCAAPNRPRRAQRAARNLAFPQQNRGSFLLMRSAARCARQNTAECAQMQVGFAIS